MLYFYSHTKFELRNVFSFTIITNLFIYYSLSFIHISDRLTHICTYKSEENIQN